MSMVCHDCYGVPGVLSLSAAEVVLSSRVPVPNSMVINVLCYCNILFSLCNADYLSEYGYYSH